MARKRKLNPQIGVLVVVLILLVAAILFISPPWDPSEAGVIVHVDPNNVTILKIAKFRYGGTPLCAACVPYKAEIDVFVNNKKICSNENSVISLSAESLNIGIKCPILIQHINQNVKIAAKGFINNKFIGSDEKELFVPVDIK